MLNMEHFRTYLAISPINPVPSFFDAGAIWVFFSGTALRHRLDDGFSLRRQ